MTTVRRTSKDDPRLPAGYVVARHLPLHVQRHLRDAGKVWLAYHKHATPECDWYVWVRTEAEAMVRTQVEYMLGPKWVVCDG